jgi:hypothetical protein
MKWRLFNSHSTELPSRPATFLCFQLGTEAENGGEQNQGSADINALTDPTQRSDAKELAQLMQRASGEKPQLWGPSIVGFGSYHYKYDSGREGDMPLISFSPRKSALVLYSMLDHSKVKPLLPKLGKHRTGKGCLYIKKLADVDKKVLETLIENAVAHNRDRKGTRDSA